MTWILCAAVVLAVCGWAVAAGLYLQLKDALKLIREERENTQLWRTIANEAWADIVRERHVAEFAVRAMEPERADLTLTNMELCDGSSECPATIHLHGCFSDVIRHA